MKMLECLPCDIADGLSKAQDLRELRIRNGGAVRLNVGGSWYYLGLKGTLHTSIRGAVVAGEICDDIVKRACSNSVYAHEKSLANGFFTLDDGVRVGVCGEVFGTDKAVFRHYSSLCFRVPHYVNCVSDNVLQRCHGNNVLVIGAPAAGKTTYLRDLAVKLGQSYNVLIADERGELFYDDALLSSSSCDVLKWCNKSYAFDVGVRAMSPDYIVCDELAENDTVFVKACLNSGVHLICSAHGKDREDFDKRFGLLDSFGVVVNLNAKAVNIVGG